MDLRRLLLVWIASGSMLAILPGLRAVLFADEKASESAVVNEERFHEALLKIAAKYRAYGRVDDEIRWAPYLCRAPKPGLARFSRSNDERTHGMKLYSLFAADRKAYLSATTQPSAVGQVVVKESWIPEETTEMAPGQTGVALPSGKTQGRDKDDHFNPYAERDGKVFKATRQGDLFIMMRLDPGTPGTDDGWVYGTVTADGKRVSSAGCVASCMKCHQTKTTRLFGFTALEERRPR